QAMLRIWDPAQGDLVRELRAPGAAPSEFYRVAVSGDGRLVAAANGAGSTVHVWNAATGVLLAELHTQPAEFPDLAFSADRWLAVTGGGDVAVFDAQTWERALTIPGPVHCLAFDSRAHLVTGAVSGDVALWDVPSGARYKHLRPFGDPVEAI